MSKKKFQTKLDKIFFWSDPHFGHRNVLKFCNRPYENIDEMHEDFIKRYNSVVPKDGTCIWVGDCFFCGKTKARAVMNKLNGQKVLVLGNHDRKMAHMYSIGFDFVCNYMEMYIAGFPVKIKHYPSKWSSNKLYNWFRLDFLAKYFGRGTKLQLFRWCKPRYFERYPEPDGRWLIHGHTHSEEPYDLPNKTIHVGVDAWDYSPVSYREIEKLIQQGEAK